MVVDTDYEEFASLPQGEKPFVLVLPDMDGIPGTSSAVNQRKWDKFALAADLHALEMDVSFSSTFVDLVEYVKVGIAMCTAGLHGHAGGVVSPGKSVHSVGVARGCWWHACPRHECFGEKVQGCKRLCPPLTVCARCSRSALLALGALCGELVFSTEVGVLAVACCSPIHPWPLAQPLGAAASMLLGSTTALLPIYHLHRRCLWFCRCCVQAHLELLLPDAPPERPIYLMGEGFGGVLALAVALESKWVGSRLECWPLRVSMFGIKWASHFGWQQQGTSRHGGRAAARLHGLCVVPAYSGAPQRRDHTHEGGALVAGIKLMPCGTLRRPVLSKCWRLVVGPLLADLVAEILGVGPSEASCFAGSHPLPG